MYAKLIDEIGDDSFRYQFVSDQTIECSPPFVKGKWDSMWIGRKLNVTDKADCESGIGIKLQEIK